LFLSQLIDIVIETDHSRAAAAAAAAATGCDD
jgi:hypothetical protein